MTIYESIALETRERARAIFTDGGDVAVAAAAPAGTRLPMHDDASFRAALDETPPHLLLAVIAHLGRDDGLLERAAPHIGSLSQGGPMIPDDLAAEIREKAAYVLLSPASADAPPLTVDRLKRIVGVIVGEQVGDEVVPLLVDQMGFQPLGSFMPRQRSRPAAGYRIGIIGAGMSGLAAGISFEREGYDYRIYEKADEVGGVWNSNRYPGVAVDTPSHFYSYSYEINPDWPRNYSTGPVLMDYWRSIAEKYKLRDRITFGTTVLSCIWHAPTSRWRIISVDQEGIESVEAYDAVVVASGLFTHPQPPKVDGLEMFEGVAVHTANWNPAVDVAGKRVIQIGTGASGVQVGPEIAPEVEHLTVFQRTAPWLSIRPNGSTRTPVPGGFKWALRHVPHLGQWMRLFTYWNASDGTHKMVVRDLAWDGNDKAISAHSEGMRQSFTGLLRQKLGERDDLFEKMLPGYPVFGKRLLQDSGWTDMMMRDNVELVTTPIDRVVADGVLDTEGRHYPADLIVLATGFAMTRMMQNMNVVGRDGVQLRDLWGDEDPRSYLGTLVPGFPNLFLINGPNAGATHGAGVNIYSEAQIHYVLEVLELMRDAGGKAVEVDREAFETYNAKLEEALAQTVWNHPKVTTYYKNSKGRNFVSCPWRIVDIWHMLRRPEKKDLVLA